MSDRARMKFCSKLVALVLVAAVGLYGEAHPGPEQHPTIRDLEEMASEIKETISDLERRFSEWNGGPEVSNDLIDREAITEAVESTTDEALAKLVQSSDELKERVDMLVAIGAWILATLSGLLAFLGLRLRALRKILKSALEEVDTDERDGKESTDAGLKEKEKEKEVSEKRIVTHTLKERIGTGMQPTIKELHNPDAEWSPRTREDVIADIRDKGILYLAQGPRGNEAEIEIRERKGRPYLSTKRDEHEGNNLSELPDPP